MGVLHFQEPRRRPRGARLPRCLAYADTPMRFPRRYVSDHGDKPIRVPLERLERNMGNNNVGPASINMPTRAQLGDEMLAVFFEQQCCSEGDQTPNYKKDRKNDR
jgi:hypothetical protein